jgi:solute carrier family 25 protein 33/36
MKFIIQNEGPRALFKGLGPTIMGVAPYRAIYFFSYANSKDFFRKYTPTEDMCHVCSAGIAGVTAVSLTNPIWFVKTRLQLNETRRGLKTLEVVQKILREKGVLGFYKGISASYFGVVETTMYFVLYEKLKTLQFNQQSNDGKDGLSIGTFFSSAAFAKTLASCLCYPHEVARTRLREEGTKYNSFFQTLNLVIKEEGIRGIYKGMATHLIRQIPNTAIVMTTYEIIVKYFLTRQTDSDDE